MAKKEGTKILREGCGMVAGDGRRSYSQNSSLQRAVADAAKEKITKDIINKLDLENYPILESVNPFSIADFGCSAGPNTFFAVENIIEAVNLKYYNDKISDDKLEFQVFFNDVTGNDFNTLFKSIPSSFPTKYFAAGVPGSFYGRLFPCSSLQIAYSCYALHWLSTVPEEVVDRNSAAWNKDSIYCTGLDAEVVKAYSGQFKEDLDTFLSARAEEIVEGGLMIILMGGLPDGILLSQTTTGYLYHLLGSCLVDLAKLGVISEEKSDSFNLPMYYSYSRELEQIINNNGCFIIEDMPILEHPPRQKAKSSIMSKVANYARAFSEGILKLSTKYIVASIRAVFEGVIKQHFGNEEDVVDMIFQHFTNKVAANYYSLLGGHRQIDHFILLKRNPNRCRNHPPDIPNLCASPNQ